MTTKAISLRQNIKLIVLLLNLTTRICHLSKLRICMNLPINSGRCTCWAFSLPRSSRRCSRLFRVPRRSSQKLGAQTYLVTAKVAKIQLGWTLGDQGKIGKTKNGTRFLGMFWSKCNDSGSRRLIHQAFLSIQMKSDSAGFQSRGIRADFFVASRARFGARFRCVVCGKDLLPESLTQWHD